MTLWNPYALTLTGKPAVLVAPPKLRFYGEPTAEQRAMAQAAFHRFAMETRTSFVPNPNKIGVMPDGSKYRIYSFGPDVQMDVWVAFVGAIERGVGVEAVFSGQPALFVLAFLKGAWRAKQVDEFYGGSGVWAGQSGRYLTDDTISPYGAALITDRHFKPGSSDTPVNRGNTSVLKGMAYKLGPLELAGVFTPARKYVVAEPAGGSNINIYEAPLLPEKEFAATPGAPAASVSYATTVHPADTNVVVTYLQRHGRYSRMRDGSAIYFNASTGAVPSYSGESVPYYGNVSGLLNYIPTNGSIDRELRVNFHPNGLYSADTIVTAPSATFTKTPEKESWVNPGFVPWRRDTHQKVTSAGYSFDYAPVHVQGLYGDYYGTSASAYIYGAKHERDAHWTKGAALEGLTIYAGRTWDGDRIEFVLSRLDVSHEVDQHYSQDSTSVKADGLWVGSDFTPAPPPYSAPGWAAGPATVQFVSEPPIPPWSTTDTNEVQYKLAFAAEVKTPWGNIKLIDDEVTTKTKLVVHDRDPYNNYEFSVDIAGRGVYRELKVIDHMLGLVGFIELVASKYTATRVVPADIETYDFATVDSGAKFVLLHKGKVLVEIPLEAGISEGFTRRSVFYENQFHVSEMSFAEGAPPGDQWSYEDRTSTAAWGFDVQPIDADGHADGHREAYFMPSTLTSTIQFGTYDVSKNDETAYVSETAEAQPIYLRPTFDPSAFKIKVRAALDPNSGGGVVVVHDDGVFKSGWCIPPSGDATPILPLLSRGGRAPNELHELAVSV